MEGEFQASSEIPVMKVLEKAHSNADSNKIIDRNLNPITIEGKKEDDETALEGEFIKIEKEPLDAKDDPHYAEKEKPLVIERSSSNSTVGRELLESQENIKELELELERVAGSLKHSESDNAQLKDEVSVTKTQLEETGKKYEALERSHHKLQEQIVESGERYNIQLKTLQEALEAQDEKHKELVGVKESFESLYLELESSRKKMEELEQDLQSSAGEARKFEELHKESSSHAESQTKKAVEFEKLLKMAKLSAKEVEDQMACLQDEVKGLHEKIAENQKVEEAHKSTTAELSAVQRELEVSKSQMVEIEQRLTSKEALLVELTQEVDLRKTSESQIKEDMSALENLLLSMKENLQVKESDLEELKLRLRKELQSKEAHVSMVQEELSKVMKEKEALEADVADLTSNATQMKELCDDLETKLQSSDENFCKADSLLSQALANCTDLEQKLKSLEELHHESGYAATTAQQKNLELEDIVIASNAAVKEAKCQLRELETRFIALEQKNVELEQLTILLELRSNDAERELREFSEKNSELIVKVEEVEEENKQLSVKIQKYEDEVTQMESVLKNAEEKCAEHEGRANTVHQRNRELEDLIQMSRSKADDAGKKVSEMELLLEAEKYRIQELEEQISALEKKCGDAEAESKKKLDKISELEMELEAFQSKASSLEVALQTANEKESELTEILRVTTEVKKNLEDGFRNSSEKLSETETLLEVLQNELNLTQQKLESIEGDLKAAGIRESEVMEKLKSAEEQLEHQNKVLGEATLKKSELETLHESLSRDSELKLQEAFAKFTTRDTEAKSLYEKLKILENQVKVYEEQIAKAAEKFTSSEKLNEELKTKISEVEEKDAQFSSENELLVETNKQLKTKVNELQESLNSAHDEKETTAEQLASHLNTIAELADKHSKASELHLVAEARISKAERELQEAILKFSHRDLEATDLIKKLNALKNQIIIYEQQAHEASDVIESQKIELEQTVLKLKGLEGIIEEMQNKSGQFEKDRGELVASNSKLMQELATYESKLNELGAKFSATVTEKDEALEQLSSSKKLIEDLTEQLALECQKVQSQRQKDSQKDSEREAALKRSFEEVEAKNEVVGVLEKQVKELEQKLQLAETKSKQKDDGGSPIEIRDGMEVKSRDIGSTISTPSKRRSKKKLEAATSPQAPSAEGVHTRHQTTDAAVFPMTTFKIVLGVALVSIIIGVILGKRY